jgi:membrane protease YdiL (CAAX protease family)
MKREISDGGAPPPAGLGAGLLPRFAGEARTGELARYCWRWTELVVLFAIGPGLLSLGPRWLLLPAILGGGLVCLAWLLLDRTFPRGRLLGAGVVRSGLARLLVRALVVAIGLFLFSLSSRGPAALFLVPRAHPALWLTIVILYPALSAYPQEIMYRTFFFHRYGELFRSPAPLIGVNAVLFGWAHVLVHNTLAMLLTTIGGLLFALTYRRGQSTLLVALEHALYGDLVFTIGIGGMFVNGVRLLSKIIG